jgi:serine/threonine protein kinase
VDHFEKERRAMTKDLIGQQLGNYQLVSLLGRGGFAEVYLGQHVDIPTLQAAIKVLHLTEVNTQKFRQEAAIIAALKHPHIIRLSDFSDRQEMPFLVMDYAPNGSLRKRHSPEDKVPLATIVQYTTQIAEALQYAHEMHIIHRDIKPDNVLIGSRGELLLSDFGIAVISETGRTTLNSPYGTAGTPYYMAPEMFRGKPDKASDQYALAVMVYQWLSGTLPFDQGDFIQLGYQHAHEPVPPLRERAPFVSEDVETVVMTALAKDPKERFATVQAFATALELASQTKQPVDGFTPSKTKPSRPKPSSSPKEPASHTAQVLTQLEMETPVEQPQPSMPKQPKQSQAQKKSPSSGSIVRHKSEFIARKAVITSVISAFITGIVLILLKSNLTATIAFSTIALITSSIAVIGIEIFLSRLVLLIKGILSAKSSKSEHLRARYKINWVSRIPLFTWFSKSGITPYACVYVIGFLCFLGLFLIVNVIRIAAGGDLDTNWSANSSDTINIPAVRGLAETVHINAGTSIQGLWATSTGLSLEFDDPTIAPLMILSPQEPTWSDQIIVTCSEAYSSNDCPSGQNMSLDCHFAIPDFAGPMTQTIHAHIKGTIIWPHDRGDNTFDTQSMDINMPVQLNVRPMSQAALFLWKMATDGLVLLVILLISMVMAFVIAMRYRHFLIDKGFAKQQGACYLCRRPAPTEYVKFYQNIGLLWRRRYRIIEGRLCKQCINGNFWKMTLITFFLGWYGVISCILTPFYLLNNIVRFILTIGMKKK